MAQVSFRGNIGKVRGLQFGQDGKPRFSFSVGESHRRFDKQTNEWQDVGTTWWNCTVFGRQAEDLADILQEGQKQQVVVSGRSQTRSYEHNGEQRTSLDVVADHVGLVHRAPQQQSGGFQQQQQAPPPAGNQQASAFGQMSQGQDVWGGQPQQQGGPVPF